MNMIEVKTSELIGPALDWSVLMAIQKTPFTDETARAFFSAAKAFDLSMITKFSTDWSQGGPLIEEHKIELLHFGETYGGWDAQLSPGDSHYIDQGPGQGQGSGPTPLVAACRAIVAAKLGDLVSVPAELVNGGAV